MKRLCPFALLDLLASLLILLSISAGLHAAPATQSARLTGTLLGTPGSYQSRGNTLTKAFDGDPATYFDAPQADGVWLGVDLGQSTALTQIEYQPRAGFRGRMVGGIFRAANKADRSDATVLGKVTAAPSEDQRTVLALNLSTAFRYIDYLAPVGSYGNIAEFAIFGQPPPPATPAAAPRPALTLGIKGVLPPAGHRVHISTKLPDYWLSDKHRLYTTVVSPAGQTLDTQPGPNASFQCLLPGQYTVKQKLDGVDLAPVEFTLAASNRSELYLSPLGLDSNSGTDASHPKRTPPVQPTRVNLHLHGTFTKTLSFDGANDVVVFDEGATLSVAGPALTFDPRTTNVTIHGLHIDSPRNAQGRGTGYVGQTQGTNVTLLQTKIGYVNDGIQDGFPGPTGLAIDGATEDSPLCNPGRMVFLLDTRQLTMVDCIALGATGESDLRSTAKLQADGTLSDGVTNFLLLRNTFAQPSTGNKAAFTLRAGSYGQISDCKIFNANGAFNSGGDTLSTPTQIQYVMIDNLQITQAKLQFEPGANHIIVRGGVFTGASECVSFRFGADSFPFPVEGIFLTGVEGHGNSHSFINVFSGNPTPAELTVQHTRFYTVTPGLPLSKNDKGAINLGEDNLTIKEN